MQRSGIREIDAVTVVICLNDCGICHSSEARAPEHAAALLNDRTPDQTE
jgi:hypothetical protein